jgi:peptidoglycan/LPS O-acetylase OafA/YrhL
MAEPRRIIELDGLRGIACLAVVCAHYFGEVDHGFRWFALGWAGVDLFFCLSGFLIGGILIDNLGSRSYFSTFYIRRCFRILPIYYVTVTAVLIVLYSLSDRRWVDPPLPALAYLTYSQNFILAIFGTEGGKWLLPTWTLCVEEQFYLLLPVILYWTPPRYLLRVLIGLIVSAPLFRLALSIVSKNHLPIHVLLPACWDLLFLGVLGAYACRSRDISEAPTASSRRLLEIVIVVSIAANPILLLLDKYLQLLSFDVIGPLLIGIAFTGFILLVVNGSPEAHRFRSKTLRFFGEISYGLYLVHQPVSGLLHGLILKERPDIGNFPQLAVTVGAFATSVAIAWLSWVYFERPLVRLGYRWSYSAATPSMAAAAPGGAVPAE